MMGKKADENIARQVEFAVTELDSISILPSVMGQFLLGLNRFELSPAGLAELIESDAALTARVFSLMRQKGAEVGTKGRWVSGAIEKLSMRTIRDEFLALKVFSGAGQDKRRSEIRKQLICHSLGTACCARAIAETTAGGIDPELSYLAGLLHNIGNLALEEAMPKSFGVLFEEARSQEVCICELQQKQLGLDYTVIGKRLGQRWGFAEQIIMAIWLHRSKAAAISGGLPEARLAGVVQLADVVTRQAGIGESGSFDSPVADDQLIEWLGLSDEQVGQIRDDLRGQFEQKCAVLGLSSGSGESDYFGALQVTAAQLAGDNTKISAENQKLSQVSGYFDFAKGVISSAGSSDQLVEVAEKIGRWWQKFYQCGSVCLYLPYPVSSDFVRAVILENHSSSRKVILQVGAETEIVPVGLGSDTSVIEVGRWGDWLFEQLGIEFERDKTKAAGLVYEGRIIGVVVFELGYPVETTRMQESVGTAAGIAGSVLGMAASGERQQGLAEYFASLVISEPVGGQSSVRAEEAGTGESELEQRQDDLLAALSEMAAGAAHELNNPLSVISGRSQMLASGESDVEKLKIFKQIEENTKELAGIIDGLMSFASPQSPRPERVRVEQILDEASQLSGQKAGIEQPDIQIETAEPEEEVYVDSAQIVSAIANIFCNSFESYELDDKPVRVSVDGGGDGEFVTLAISDSGCGMDLETAKKATAPFFSAKAAGRKRGMGLSYANRLIRCNHGSLEITSKSGEGTTVTVSLPRRPGGQISV